MATNTTTLKVDVDYDPEKTDPEALASAMDRLMETVLSTPGIMEEYGEIKVDEFFVLECPDALPQQAPRVLLSIEGGVVQDVYGTRQPTEVTVVDFDTEGEALGDHPSLVSLPDSGRLVSVRQPAVIRWKLMGRDLVAAIRAAGVRGDQANATSHGRMNGVQPYALHLDGPLFRRQRELLLKIADLVRRGRRWKPLPGDGQLLEGLIELTDAVADQAHDRHGIDCLLTDEDDGRCECEKPGFFCSGVPGILAHMENGHLPEGAVVNHCDLCQRYPSDAAALEKLRELGHNPP